MIIRQFKKDDVQEIITLIYDSVHEVCKEDYTEEQLDAWQPKFSDSKRWESALSKNYCIVAVEDEKIIGVADIGEAGYIDNLFVHVDHLHVGIAKKLYDHIEAYAKENDYAFIDAAATITSLPFFERQGFKTVQDVMVERRNVRMRRYVVEKKL